MIMPIDTHSLQIFDVIQKRIGISLNEYRRQEIARFLNQKALSQTESAEFLRQLELQPLTHIVWQDLLHYITIGETYFFRNRVHFEALRNHILPDLIAWRRQEGRKQLRFWNAGCATGEEPYSLAILLRELLPDVESWSILILATDVNQAYLKKAQQGEFNERAFRNETPDYVRDRWFKQTGRFYRIDRVLRDMVTFLPLNLIEDDYPAFHNGTGSMDLIMCRNVTIYFTREQTQRIIARFHESLNPQGWLIVGHSEPQPGLYDQFDTERVGDGTFYRKPARIQQAPVTPMVITAPPPPIPRLILPVKPPPPVEDTPPEAVPLWQQALLAADQERWDDAVLLLDQAEAENAMQAEVHYLRALVYLQHQQEQSAFTSLRQAIYCDPNFAMAHYTLGECFARQHNTKQAQRYWRQALTIVSSLKPDEVLHGTLDMTAEMLMGLLHYQLSQQTGKG